MVIPTVITKKDGSERAYDIYSRILVDRIVILTGGIDDEVASIITAELLFLESENPDKDIFMYINSPGGVVSAGLAIYDVMQHIKPDVATVCIGQCASMGSFLLAGGKKGKRYAARSSRIMIHQPSGGTQGQQTDIQIQAKEITRLRQYLEMELSKNCSIPYEKMSAACERDNFMDAHEAKAFGIVDEILGHEGHEKGTPV